MVLSNRKISFWLFQASYWFLYFIFISEFIYGDYPINHWIVAGYCFFAAAFGLPLSMALKTVFEIRKIRNLARYYFILIVIFSSFVLAHFWLIEIKVLDYFLSTYFNVPTAVHYIREIIVDTIVLSIWGFLFLLFNSWYELSVQQEKIEKAYLLARNAQLNALRYQINPHFLFNALNSVRALIYKSPSDADEMISRLSDFMRYSLSRQNEQEIPLEEEIEVIKSYLNIEKIRFGEKLKSEINIDPIANEYPVPPFLVIPLIENAVKYGMKTSKMPLEISVKAEVEKNDLKLSIHNSGSWFIDNNIERKGFESTGTGLKNISDRLENMYPGKHEFTIKKASDCVSVIIIISKEVPDAEAK